MPRRAWALLIGLGAFAAVIVGVLAWAALSGAAGSQRGLVIRSEIPEPVLVQLANGQEATLGEGREEWTFVIKREQFPITITVSRTDGVALYDRRFAYDELADAEFRFSIDRDGFYPTTELRSTPAPR